MQWLNEPVGWQRTNDVLRVTVDPGTDFWRATGYGYIHDNGHVYGEVLPGDLDVSVRLRGSFAHQYDQAGIMLRADDRTWLKTGVEFFEGRPRLSTVLTLGWSSWMVADLPAELDEITLRMSRRGEAVEIRYAAGEGPAELAALVFMPPDREMLAGVMCAAPEGSGFIVSFYDLRVAGRDWGGPAAGQAEGNAAQAWDGQPETDAAIGWNGQPETDAAPAWGGQPEADPDHAWEEPSGGGGSADWREPRPRTAAGWLDGPPEGMPAEWADERPAGVPAESGSERPDWAGDQSASQPSPDGPPAREQAPGWPEERSGGTVLDWAQPLASDAVSDWDRLSGSLAAARGADPADEQPQPGGKKRRGGEPASKRRDGGPGDGAPGGGGLSGGGLSGGGLSGSGLSGSGLSGSEPGSKRRGGGEPGSGEPGSAEAASKRRGSEPAGNESSGREPGRGEPGGKEHTGGERGGKRRGGREPAAGQTRSLPDDLTDPVLPAATEDRPAPATRKRGTPKLPGARLSGAAGSSEPADAADEWISLLTAEDPVEE